MRIPEHINAHGSHSNGDPFSGKEYGRQNTALYEMQVPDRWDSALVTLLLTSLFCQNYVGWIWWPCFPQEPSARTAVREEHTAAHARARQSADAPEVSCQLVSLQPDDFLINEWQKLVPDWKVSSSAHQSSALCALVVVLLCGVEKILYFLTGHMLST